jgi:hypothetical protein
VPLCSPIFLCFSVGYGPTTWSVEVHVGRRDHLLVLLEELIYHLGGADPFWSLFGGVYGVAQAFGQVDLLRVKLHHPIPHSSCLLKWMQAIFLEGAEIASSEFVGGV